MENAAISELTEREKWCLEKVDFITAVVGNVNREVVWANVAFCHSNKDVSKLLQRLLKDNGDSVETDDSEGDISHRRGNRGGSDYSYDNRRDIHRVKRLDSQKEYRRGDDDFDDTSLLRGDRSVSDHVNNIREDIYQEHRRENDDSDNEYINQRVNRRVTDKHNDKHQATTNGHYLQNRHDVNYDDRNNHQGNRKHFNYHEHNDDDDSYSIDGKGMHDGGAVGYNSRVPSSKHSTQHEEDPQEDEDDIVIHIFNQVTSLTEIFPDVDPVYLQKRCWKAKADPKAYTRLVEELLRQKDQPRRSKEENFPEKLVEHPSVQYNSSSPREEEEEKENTLDDQEQECGICCDDVAGKDMVACNAKNNQHSFCRNCVKRFVEEEIGQGRSTFRCLDLECKGQISNARLKGLLTDKVFERIMTRQQQEEIESAGIDDLLSCPFCDFMMILPDKKDIVFLCQNPECGKDSCRFCKEPNHCPQTCEEVKVDKQKDARTMLENRMAEAMIRECFKCRKRFIKEAGCNLMTCACGAKMCYQCKQTVNGYDHFHRGPGACVLHGDATSIHVREVKKAAEEAKKELDPNIQLVHDPTKGVI